jgi:hypothetical protein
MSFAGASLALHPHEVTAGGSQVKSVRDLRSILELQPDLSDLGRRAGQPGAMDDLNYFLRWLESRGKALWLISTSSEGRQHGVLDGAVLMYEHRLGGYGLRILAAFDETGRRTLVSRGMDSVEFALKATRKMLREGAQCILISFCHGEAELDAARVESLAGAGYSLRWASRKKSLASYLKVESTLDETLAPMGMRTRKHMRYYMRRAATDLGATFVANPVISLEEFMELNAASAYRATEDVARWRYSSYTAARSPVLYGLRDRDGRWLSMIGGLHAGDYMELYWQMNREELKQYSLGTAMRAFTLEHEISLGTKRFYVEGGTSHTMSNAFVHEPCTDLLVLRDTAAARTIPALIKRFVPPENPMYEFLEHPELTWHSIKGRRH